MNKRPLILASALVAVTLLIAMAPSASGQDALRKFGRGFGNLTWGWTDLPMTIHREDTLNGPAAAYSFGIVKGLAKAFSRTAVGIFEMVSFPVAWPDGYWPIVNPEFPLETYNENVLMYE